MACDQGALPLDERVADAAELDDITGGTGSRY
jgi:hypothetical protein